jgi:hypothetical protein
MIADPLEETEFLFDARTDFGFYPETTTTLLGWPGYRNLPGKSGLTYLETTAEEAHFEGSMLRWLWDRKIITHNPIYLGVFFIFGMLTGGLPSFFALLGLLAGNSTGLGLLLLGSPIPVLGLALLRNVWDSLTRPTEISLLGD